MDGSANAIEEKIVNCRTHGLPSVWKADNGDGTYTNPILHTDYSDPDAIRIGKDYYMTASSFNNIPGLPILHSKDLVNWRLINYAIKDGLPFEAYNSPQYGKGVWAPSIRFHRGHYHIYFATPDEGIFMTRTKSPGGSWSPLLHLKATRGWIDTCPFWDDDGRAYLVNAFAFSRIGFKSLLAITEMNDDGTELLLPDNFRIVYDGNERNPNIEGPKLFKRNGFYYISAPAGGVKQGWQVILRSRSIYGPYEEKIVLHQGNTDINGPHQGALVNCQDGTWWFLHFQDKGAYGRIVHLQPVEWVDDWPLIGINRNADGVGEPVLVYKKPHADEPTSDCNGFDDFTVGAPDTAWQWNANPKAGWFSMEDGIGDGKLRLYAVNTYGGKTPELWNLANIFSQKFPAEEFTVTAKIEPSFLRAGERAGLTVMGNNYAALELVLGVDGRCYLNCLQGAGEAQHAAENVTYAVQIAENALYLRFVVSKGARCVFSYSTDGSEFIAPGLRFKATQNTWVGAKFGLYCRYSGKDSDTGGFADFDWIMVEK